MYANIGIFPLPEGVISKEKEGIYQQFLKLSATPAALAV